MQGSYPSPSPSHPAIFRKYGFLIMAPIALIVHGLVVLIPTGSPQQKAKEPEKKEEILSIGSIAQLPATQLPSTVASASQKPTSTKSAPPIVQPQPQNPVPAPIVQPQTPQQTAKTPDHSSEMQQLQKKLEDLQNKVQQQAAKPTQPEQPTKPTQPEQPAPSPSPIIMSDTTIGGLPGSTACPGNEGCFVIESQVSVAEALAEKFNRPVEPIEVVIDGDRRSIGFKIRDSAGKPLVFVYRVDATRIQRTSKELSIDEIRKINPVYKEATVVV